MTKYLKIYLFSVLIFSILSCSAQSSQIDSLINILEVQKSEEKMATLQKLCREYINNSVEDVIKYANELLILAEQESNLEYIDKAHSFLGEAYFYMNELDKSIEYFEKYLETKILQEDIAGIGDAYNNLGIVYRYIEKHETAIQYYLESLAIKERLKDTAGLSSTLNNIGVLYFYMGNYNEALDYYIRSYNLEIKIGNKSGIATSLLNIGEVHSYLNNYSDALSHFNRSIEISKSIEDMHTLEVNYQCMYEMYKRQVNFQKALYYHELYTEIRNDRLSQESRKEIAELEIKHETSKKEKEIELLNKQNELNRIIIFILSIAFFVFIFLLILLYKQGQVKKKTLELLSEKNEEITLQSEILNKLNNTKDKFFSIISHDLKGAIGGFLSQTEFLAEDFKSLPSDDMHDLIIKMKYSSKRLYALLENLLEWSRTQTDSIKLQPEKSNLLELVENILLIFKESMKEKGIKPIVKVDSSLHIFADINMVSTVFRNLITNAIKFSHPNTSITIHSYSSSGFILTEVIDHGIGITDKNQKKLFRIDHSFSSYGTSNESGSGLGLIICKEFIELNQGKIWVDSKIGEGSSFKFTLKKA